MYVLCMQLKGDYVVEIEVHSYFNPSSRCAGPECGCTISDSSPTQGCRCCDGDFPTTSSCDIDNRDRCDNKFTYCLRHLAPLSTSVDGACSQAVSSVNTSMVNWNDVNISFAADVVLGLSNSFTLRGLDNAWMV